jgi:pimeloyl-ACP methyl ester carboxylesterase
MKLSAQRIGGRGTPTVLLHGFLGSGKNLRTVAQRWSERDASRVFLLPDLRGHGSSPPVEQGTDLRAMAHDVIDTARAEQLHGALEIVGHSLGGRVGLAASLVAPADISRVTFLDITPSPIASERSQSGRVLQVLLQAPEGAPDRRQMRAALIDRGLSPALADWLMMNVVQEGGSYRWRFDRAALSRLHERVNSEDLWEAIERPGAQVRCIRGGASGYVSSADVERMLRAGCRVDTLEGAGHFVHVDALEPLLDLLAAG